MARKEIPYTQENQILLNEAFKRIDENFIDLYDNKKDDFIPIEENQYGTHPSFATEEELFTYLVQQVKTPYGLAVEDGFTGTLTEWLDSLKGEDLSNILDVLTISTDNINLEHRDDQLNHVNTSTNGGHTIIVKKTYSETVNINNIYFKAGNTINGNSFWLYTVDSNAIITKKIGEFSFTPITNQSVEIPVNFELNTGDRLAFLLVDGLTIKYNASNNDAGFLFNLYGSTEKDLNVGETINATQNFDIGVSIGWDGYIEGVEELISVKNRLRYIDDNGYANNNFQVPYEPINLNSPISKSWLLNNFEISNILSGIPFLVIGDSMVYGHSTDQNKIWGKLIADRNNMPFTNLGINGNRLTDSGGSNPMVNRIDDIPNGFSGIIAIGIGTNDAQANITIGDPTSTNIAEFNGALNVALDAIQARCPNALIVYISPYKRNSNYENFNAAILGRCFERGIPVKDNIASPKLDWSDDYVITNYTLNDNYHFNDLGHYINSFDYEKFIRENYYVFINNLV